MRILIVAATALEVGPLVANLGDTSARGPRLTTSTYAGNNVDVLVTGVGMVSTAAWCSRVLSQTRYDLGLNVGVCGTFDPAIGLGEVVHVVSDRIAELGAEDDDTFLTIQELTLPGEDAFVNTAPPRNAALNSLPAVRGITVNTVHGNARSIDAVIQRFAPQIESMEGAAFMYACVIHALPFAQVRAVSNIVEKRNLEAWNLGEAIANLNRCAQGILEHL